ncbi:MAG TPA: ATP-binding protein [Clostridia bacterium]|nr:ATP-binding protein [Clostridia bacterium]
MPYETTLIRLLKVKDEELYGRLLHIGEFAKPLLSYTQGKFPFYTPHDFFHSEMVRENLDWIIPDTIKEGMNSYEIFFLLVAAWLHDWGMIGTSDEDPIIIRENHHIRTEANFEKFYSKLTLSEHEALIAGRISKGHRKVDLYSDEYNEVIIGQGVRVRTRFLAALLRLADETDITHSRAPEIIYYTINPSGNSEEEFKKHLSISGIGQLDEKHKIYISAIARDPMGAEAIRKLVIKIQNELNTVKSILSQNGVAIDTIDLRLEARGFVDKPIGFEINGNKIVELLIGKHLYGRYDVALRELIQNAMDSCYTKSLLEVQYSPEILIEKDENSLTITDNGIGMGFHEAKHFLSKVGDTFYQSEDLRSMLKNKSYDPISNFGIGILSTFLIADRLIIDTKKDGQEGCLFTITALGQKWKYEKGSMKKSGTSIKLFLNSTGKSLDLENSLNQYFISIDIPLWIRIDGKKTSQFINFWSGEEIVKRFLKEQYTEDNIEVKTIAEIDSPEFSAILVECNDYLIEQLVVFNRGIFVKKYREHNLDGRYAVFINLKKSLVDFHISREDIIQNDRWYAMLHKVYNSILNEIQRIDCDNADTFIWRLSDMIEYRSSTKISNEGLFEDQPLLFSFYENAPFPVVSKEKIEYSTLPNILRANDNVFFKSASTRYTDEAELLQKFSRNAKVVFVPYRLPAFSDKRGVEQDVTDFVKYLCIRYGKEYREKDLRMVLLENAVQDKNEYKSICPSNVRFATFGNLKPLVVVLEFPLVSEKFPYLGCAYWGNQLLFWELIDSERKTEYSHAFEAFKDKRYECIKLVKEHIVLLDSSDTFINSILKNEAKFTYEQAALVSRYFRYLSYLPLIVHNFESCQMIIEVLDKLEKEIALVISIDRPQCIFSRMKPDSSIYTQYFNRYGMNYEVVDV